MLYCFRVSPPSPARLDGAVQFAGGGSQGQLFCRGRFHAEPIATPENKRKRFSRLFLGYPKRPQVPTVPPRGYPPRHIHGERLLAAGPMADHVGLGRQVDVGQRTAPAHIPPPAVGYSLSFGGTPAGYTPPPGAQYGFCLPGHRGDIADVAHLAPLPPWVALAGLARQAHPHRAQTRPRPPVPTLATRSAAIGVVCDYLGGPPGQGPGPAACLACTPPGRPRLHG